MTGSVPPSSPPSVELLNYKVDQLDKKFDTLTSELKNSYASKAEVQEIREDVAGLKSGVWWILKIVGAAIVLALLSLVLIKTGVPKP